MVRRRHSRRPSKPNSRPTRRHCPSTRRPASCGLGFEQRLADPLGGKHRAARAESTRTTSAFNLSSRSPFRSAPRCVAAGRTLRRLAVDDIAGDGDDSDRAVRGLPTLPRCSPSRLDLLVAGNSLDSLATELRQPRLEGRGLPSLSTSLRRAPPCRCRRRRLTARACRACSVNVRVRPSLGTPSRQVSSKALASACAFSRASGDMSVAGEGLDSGLVGADAIDVRSDAQLVEKSLVSRGAGRPARQRPRGQAG